MATAAIETEDRLAAVEADLEKIRSEVRWILRTQQAQLDALRRAVVALGDDVQMKKLLDFPSAAAIDVVRDSAAQAVQASGALAEPAHR